MKDLKVHFRIVAIVLFIILKGLSNLWAQTTNTTSILGKVVEETTGEAMAFVNITLHNVIDSLIVQGTTSTENGDFKFENVASGSYYVQLSFIGFEKTIINQFDISGIDQVMSLGKISMKVLSGVLSEVI